jgi:ABC-type polar amino acid transport system ATPase subunit
VIVVEAVRKRIGGRVVLDDVSLKVRPGTIVGIIGPSAAGKTTVLKVINGLEPFAAGRITVGDVSLTPMMRPADPVATSIRRNVGMVFQHLNLWSYKTVLENITEGPIFVQRMQRREAVGRATDWARELGIVDQLHQYPHQLSGGQRQRVAIARAVVMEPQYLLLDEITSALDPILAGEIADTMLQLKDRGMGIALVSHQIDFVRRNADHVHFLQAGRFLEQGPPESIIDHPQTPELRAFIEAIHHGW